MGIFGRKLSVFAFHFQETFASLRLCHCFVNLFLRSLNRIFAKKALESADDEVNRSIARTKVNIIGIFLYFFEIRIEHIFPSLYVCCMCSILFSFKSNYDLFSFFLFLLSLLRQKFERFIMFDTQSTDL